MIPVILKGDTSAKISLAVADGWDFSAVVLEVGFCGTVTTIVEPVAGSVIDVAFTAEQSASFPLGTHMVTMTLRNDEGGRCTLPWGKIKVTDAPGEVYDAAISVDPGTIAVDDATAADSLGDVKAKLNKVLDYLRGVTVGLLVAFALPCFGAGVQTAALNDIPGNAQVVTNVAFEGLVSMTDLAAATNAIPTREEYNTLADRGEKIEVATNTTEWAYDITGTVTGKKYDASDEAAGHIHLRWQESATPTGQIGWTYDQGFKVASTDPNADAVQYTVDAAFWTDAAHTNAYYEVVRVVATRRVAGKTYNRKTLATINDLISAPAVTNIARAVQNTVYDPALGVAWTAYMHNGSLYYIATTNAPAQEVAE